MEGNNKGVLAVVVLVLLALGGGGIYWVLRPKNKDTEPKEKAPVEDKPPVRGRDSLTGYKVDEQKIKDLFYKDDEKNPEAKAVLLGSDEAYKLIEETADKMQNDPAISKLIRKKYEVGKNILQGAFNEKAKRALKGMFSLIDGVNGEDYTTYPIYGEYEGLASKLREELKAFSDVYYKGHNLTKYRRGEKTWWISSIGVNIIFGSQNSHNWTAHEIWANAADQSSLDFYKEVNGHDVANIFLIEKFLADKNAAYVAGGTAKLVEKWLDEMARYDAVTKKYAVDVLVQQGLIVRKEEDRQAAEQKQRGTTGKGGATKK